MLGPRVAQSMSTALKKFVTGKATMKANMKTYHYYDNVRGPLVRGMPGGLGRCPPPPSGGAVPELPRVAWWLSPHHVTCP